MNQEPFIPSGAINTRVAWRPVLRPVTALVIAAQLALVLQPLSALAQDKGTPAFNPAAQSQIKRLNLLSRDIEAAKAQKRKDEASPADQASAALTRIEEITKALRPDARARALQQSQRGQHQAELKSLLRGQASAQAALRADFEVTRSELAAKRLPAEILARHDEAARQFEQRSAQFKQISQRVDSDQPGSLEELDAFFAQHPNSKRASPRIDPAHPKKLPWSAPEPTRRLPAETKTAWQQNLHNDFYKSQGVQLAQAGGGNIAGIAFTQLPEPGVAPTAADLAETDEVQLTPAIQAKALELGRNPVNIHNWVQSSIEFAPTWGAIQSAQDTLDKKRGNALDTASLEIALLRASGIPARYQFGTIEVSAGQLQNWVGGASAPEAAQQLIAQGGIASRGIAEGGRLAKVRMEHVWVQAYVNWAPSRGKRNASAAQHVNPNGQLNAWVPLDASFKQYSYSAAMDLKGQVPLDATALLNAASQGATVNESEGWVQNLNQAAIQSQLTDYQARLKAYIDASPTGAGSIVGDVIGRKIIPEQITELLAGSLPYALVQAGSQTSAVPAGLQHQFTYSLSTAGWDDTPILSYTEKLSKIVGKRLTLSYIPASQADADLIASYLPKPHADGTPILPSELPTSLPGYLIQLKAQINLDGVPVATSSTALPMGTDLNSTGGFTQLGDPAQWDLTSEQSNVVGQATAIGISAGGISPAQMAQLKDRLTATKTKLEAKDVTGLTGEQISGDLLTATIWSWFAAAESHNRLSQGQAGMIENPGLSYGLFHAIAQPVYSWGVIRKVTFPGVNMDIGHIRNLGWAKDNDRATWIGYNKLRGQYMSALEHAIPERFFNDPAQCNTQGTTTPVAGLPDCPQGISAVKALGLAAAQGQKIYTITQAVYQANPNIVNTALSAHSASTRQAVQNALDAGHEVTIHEKPITQSGWTGAGYTTIDPETGAGGYMIDGGSNGGDLYSTRDIQLMILAGTGMALQILALFAFPGAAGLVASIVASIVGVTVGLIGIDAQYENKKLCLTETQGASINNAITAISFLGQWGGIPPAAGITNVIVYTGLIAIAYEMAYFMKLNRAIGDC